jgi:hypothetical protein
MADLRDNVLMIVVNGASNAAAEAYAVRSGADPAEASRLVADARKRLTIAADYARDEQVGRAVMRLDSLYAKSISDGDTKTALQAQRELNRLLDLYARPDSGQGTGEDSASIRRQLDTIEGHLRPLNLADESYPVEELARLAADSIRNFTKR